MFEGTRKLSRRSSAHQQFLKACLAPRSRRSLLQEIGQGQSEGVKDSWVDEGDGDVARPVGGGQALVEVGQPPGVHEAPALPGRVDGTVVAMELAASALRADIGLIFNYSYFIHSFISGEH